MANPNLTEQATNIHIADFYSKEGRSLYLRKIMFNDNGASAMIIMLFPSATNGIDTTCQKCINNCLRLEISSLSIVNIFSRNENNTPSSDKINNSVILQEAEQCDQVILAFGSGKSYTERKGELLTMLQHCKDKLVTLKSSKGTLCSHPLSPYCKEWDIVPFEFGDKA